jgi:hypothetical protein
MLIFAMPASMKLWKSSAARPVPPWRTTGRSVLAVNSAARSWRRTGVDLYWPWAVPSCELVHRVRVHRHVGADAVLDADDVLDLGLDGHTGGVRLGDDLAGLGPGGVEVAVGGVEEDGVPAVLDDLGDHGPVRAVVEVQGDRGARLSCRVPVGGREDLGAEHLHGLHRRLEDDRRVRLLGGGHDRADRVRVDDVDGGDRVPVAASGLYEIKSLGDGHWRYLFPGGHGTGAASNRPRWGVRPPSTIHVSTTWVECSTPAILAARGD